jgi:hypothetical protein
MNDIGAMAPGRWHSWQFCCRIGSTSLLKVGAAGAAAESGVDDGHAAPAATKATNSVGSRNRRIRLLFETRYYIPK